MKLALKPIFQRLLTGLGAQAFSQVITLSVRLTEVPLFLAFWGAEHYGEWLMVAAIPSYLAMADGGFTGTTQREMIMRMGAGDRQGALAAFQSTWVMLLVLSIALLGLIFLATTLLPLDQWIKLNSMQGEALTVVIMLLTVHVILGFQCGLMYGGYSCEGRYARGTYMQSFGHLFDFGGLALAVVLGGGPIAAAGGGLAGRVLGLLLFFVDVPRVTPWLQFGWRQASIEHVTRLLRPSLASMAFPLGTALNHQGMRLMVGLALGPAAVSVFSSIRTLCRSALQPLSIMVRLIEPELALAYGAGNQSLVRALFLRASQITVWLVLAACLLLWFLGEPLLQIWGRGKIVLDIPLFTWLLLASAVNGLWYIALMVPYSTNRHGDLAIFFVLVNAFMLLLAPIFMNWQGMFGAGVVVFLAELAMVFLVTPVALFLTKTKLLDWLKAIIKFPAMRLMK